MHASEFECAIDDNGKLLIEMLRSGGDYLFLRKLWGHFRATFASENPLHNLIWSRAESLMRHFMCELVSFLLVVVVTGHLGVSGGMAYSIPEC